jgi:sugar/nucleoside kinase (ribokinase family)
MSDRRPLRVLAVGDALVDLVIHRDQQRAVRARGGSAASIAAGCAQLGIPAVFVGVCGGDGEGVFYRRALAATGCQPRLRIAAGLPTGRVLARVGPDGERTMQACPGAAATLCASDIGADLLTAATVVVLEGYLLRDRELCRTVAARSRRAGCLLALDLGSPEVVRAARPLITELLGGGVDLLFANRPEVLAWDPRGMEHAVDDLAGRVEVGGFKLGAEGAVISHRAERLRVGAVPVRSVNSLGAGDSWAAGFLAAYCRRLALADCGRMAALAAAATVERRGPHPPRARWLQLRSHLERLRPAASAARGGSAGEVPRPR